VHFGCLLSRFLTTSFFRIFGNVQPAIYADDAAVVVVVVRVIPSNAGGREGRSAKRTKTGAPLIQPV
jgi:hypothetical protein